MKYILPLVVINFKVYSEIFGEKGLEIARIAEGLSEEQNLTIMVAPPTAELVSYTANLKIPVLAQHADPVEPGKETGFVPVELLHSAGADGSILNHSEHPVMLKDIGYLIRKLKMKEMISLVCAPTPVESASISMFMPDIIAIEPPELIGGDVSVSTAKPKILDETLEMVRKVNEHLPVLCGAGIKNGEDVRKAIDHEMDGILVSSGVVTNKNPKHALEDLISPF